MGSENEVAIKPLGGTPSTTDALLSSVLLQGGINSESPVIFLFDNDKSGRSAFRKLCSSPPGQDPACYQGRIFVWSLPFTEEFQSFMKRRSIGADQAFFTAEFLLPASEAASLCEEIVGECSGSNVDEWRTTIHGDYWQSLGQRRYQAMISAKEGTTDWFYARGVPDFAKSKFWQEANKRNFSTKDVDRIINTAINTLNS